MEYTPLLPSVLKGSREKKVILTKRPAKVIMFH
jgi:hypothetical protein